MPGESMAAEESETHRVLRGCARVSRNQPCAAGTARPWGLLLAMPKDLGAAETLKGSLLE